ncbi:CopG family transcriptional regulator [Propionigenium maris DSM 9537]|uniref:CopG family transcriptional regulator n=1 Tax=Propionigenium maris DSM 9537 TaxID=1123000 RepID=A0A9W6LN18_9FUSO|nr:TM1266 family iron-only hydrogenase system putative regulator [Propionigenium maris]GLI55445.1 CopG family transcriptional regulator [Propionigenium maris DSM 9537]
MSRVATMSIFIDERESIIKANEILMEYSDIIVSRMGIPYRERGLSVIVLILDGDTDKIGALSGKIGNLKGISVKTAMKK